MKKSGMCVRVWVLALAGMVLGLAAVAADITWVGGSSGVWSNPDNWSAGVPGSGDNAVIGAAGAAITVDTAVAAASLTVKGVAVLDLREVGESVSLPAVSCSAAAWLDILSDEAVFISGAVEGALPGIFINGRPAGYDEELGVVAIAGNTTASLKALGPDMIPDDADVAAVVDQAGSGGGITLEKDFTTIYSLRQDYGAAQAYIDLAGGTLAASRLEIDSSGGDLVLGDGGYVTAPASQAAPDGVAVFPTLSGDPLIWYDFADVGSVTTNADGRIATVTNLGSAGATLNAGANEMLLGPLYVDSGIKGQMVARTDGYRVSQGLDSLNKTGISGKTARTFFVVAKRLTMTDKNFYAVFMGEEVGNKAFGVCPQKTDVNFMTFSNDINNTGTPPDGFNVYCFTTGVDETPDKGVAFINDVSAGEKDFSLNTTDTPLRLMNRPNLASPNVSGPGELGEFLLFNRTLESGERSAVAAYLMQKWGVATGKSREQRLLTVKNESESAALEIDAGVSDPYGGYLNLVKDGVGGAVVGGNPIYGGFTDIKAGELTFNVADGESHILAGGVRGSGSLVKEGGGALALGQPGSYSGGTVVRDGTLLASHNGAFGSGPVVIEDGGALDIKYHALHDDNTGLLLNKVFAEGAGPDGLGALRYGGKDGDRQQNMFSDVTLTGDLTLYTSGRFDIRNGKLDFGGYSMTLNGVSSFALNTLMVSGVTPDTSVTVNSGGFRFENSDFKGSALNNVSVASGANVALYNMSTPMLWSLTLADGASYVVGQGSASQNIWAGPVGLAGGSANFEISGDGNSSLSGVVSGAGAMSKSGSGTLWLLGDENSYAGGTSVSGGTLYTVAEGSIGVQGASGLTVSDTGTFIARVASSGWTQSQVLDLLNESVFVTPRTTSLGVDLVEGDMELEDAPNMGLAKMGPYKLTLTGEAPDMGGITVYEGELDMSGTGEHDLEKQSVIVGAGNTGSGLAVLRMPGASLLTEDPGYNRAGPTITVGDVSGSRAVLYMDEDSELYGRLMVGSQGGSAGAVYQSGGTVVNTGGSNNEAAIGGSGYGYYRLDDGLLAHKGNTRVTRSSGSIGIYEQYGGESRINKGSGTLPGTGEYDDYYNGIISAKRGIARFLLAGGVFNHNDHTFQLGEWDNSDKVDGDSSLTIEGSGEMYGLLKVVMADRNNNCEAYLNLNGGVLSTPFFLKGGNNESSNNNSRAAIGLNGGLLKVETEGKRVELVQTGKYNTPAVVNVYSGGARIEVPESGDTSVLSEPLQAPVGFGVSEITVTSAGAGYIGPPAVQLKGGGGFGATALAEINPLTGEVTGVRVTSSGSGYTSAPSATLKGGGFTTAAAISCKIASNPLGGGLTKLGHGTLELAAANTYFGATLVSEGVLRLTGGAETLPSGTAVTIDGGTLDLGGMTITNSAPIVLKEGAVLNGMVAGGITKMGSGTAVLDGGALGLSGAERRDAAIKALQPLIWYDPADVATITFDESDRVVRMQNKGTLGSSHDAVPIVPEGSTKYLTGGSSISPLGVGVLHVDGANARMKSVSNLPVIGTAPRTLIALLARSSGSGSGIRGAVGMGNGSDGQTFEIGVDPGKTYLTGIAGDRDTNLTTGIPGADKLAVVAGANGYGGSLIRGVTIWRSTGSGWDTLSATWPNDLGTVAAPLHIGRRNNDTYQGKVGAVLLFDRRLTQDELDIVRDALVAKYLIAPEDEGEEAVAGVRVEEGTLKLADSAASIAALNPILWYDPSDSGTVTVDGSGKVTALANKGSMGADMNAVTGVSNGSVNLLPPALAEGSSSYAKSGLPMLSVSANNEGLGSINSTGISGSAPRTVVGVFARHDNSGGPIVCFGNGSARQMFEVGDRESGNIVGCYGDNNDIFMTPVNPIKEVNVIIGANISSDTTACWRSGVAPNYRQLKITGDLDTANSRFVIGQRRGIESRIDFRGQIGEVMLFDRLLEEEERLLVEEYLRAKWMRSTTPDEYYASSEFEVASGAVLDLNGERQGVVVSGSGSVVNGRVGTGFVISPAGDAGIGTLSFSDVTFGGGVTYRLTTTAKQSDKIVVSGDLSGMTIVPATADEVTGGTYIVASGVITAKPQIDGFPEKYKLVLKGSELVLTKEGGTLMLLR